MSIADTTLPASRVFVLDDHDVIHQGFRGLLGSVPDLDLVGGATTAAEALKKVPAMQPDVAVLDINLPDGNGIEVCRQLRAMMPGLRCLIITSDSDDDAFFAALLAGATGFVTKRASADDILEAVRRTARNQIGMDREVTDALLDQLEDAGRSDGTDGPLQLTSVAELGELGPRQRQVLHLVLQGQTNAEISTDLALTETAVARNIAVLFTKLGLQRRLRTASLEANRIEGADGPAGSELLG